MENTAGRQARMRRAPWVRFAGSCVLFSGVMVLFWGVSELAYMTLSVPDAFGPFDDPPLWQPTLHAIAGLATATAGAIVVLRARTEPLSILDAPE